jgi:hypothetical protein
MGFEFETIVSLAGEHFAMTEQRQKRSLPYTLKNCTDKKTHHMILSRIT